MTLRVPPSSFSFVFRSPDPHLPLPPGWWVQSWYGNTDLSAPIPKAHFPVQAGSFWKRVIYTLKKNIWKKWTPSFDGVCAFLGQKTVAAIS